ncbi:hypothetical protein T484DRAFT_3649309 [Baffinella frigidus]|nr:hypothetical protein T484DRAFT_3649309 [Cryptophyta sp. CCMP2293]
MSRVETVREVMAEVTREKDELVARLNATHQRIEEEHDPISKARLKFEWAEEKEQSLEALNTIVASLQRVLEEEDMMGEMAPAASSTLGSTASLGVSAPGSNVSSVSSAATRPHGASSQSSTPKHTSAFQKAMAKIYQDLSDEASQDAAPSPPRQKAQAPHRSSAAPPRAPAGRLVGKDGGEPAHTPAAMVRRLSKEAALLQEQVRRSLTGKAQRFSSSMLRRVGWDPALQESQRVWDYSV